MAIGKDFGAGQDPSATTVTINNTVIVPTNTKRNWLVMTNVGDVDVWYSFGKDAVARKGMFMGARGGSVVLGDTFRNGEAVNGITEAGTCLVVYQEGA